MARVTIIAMLMCGLFAACNQLDPVNVQSLCEGAGPIPEECPQCQSRPFEASCPQCQMSGLDAETCLPPGVPKATMTEDTTGEASPDGGGTLPTGDNMVPGTGPDAEPGAGEAGAGADPGSMGGAGNSAEPSGGSGGSGALPPGVEPMASGDPANQQPRGCQFEGCNTPGYPACRPDGVCSECLMDDHCPDGQCDVPQNRCVECMNDLGCEAKGLVCYKDARRCVQCNDDGHCAATPETPACNANHECVACLQDIHCPSATPACDQMTCYECRMDTQCNAPGKHACIEAEHTCVECKNDMHCSSEPGRSLCNVDANECVQCLSDSDCSDRGSSNCDSETHTCVPCNDNAQCAQFAGTAPRCAAGNCVACDADGGICNGKACILSSNVCSTKNRQSVQPCGECESSDECVPGHVCVPVRYGSINTGNFCMPNLADFRGGCPRPFGRKVNNVLTLEDFRVQTLCSLAEDTTCEALKDTLASKDCGSNNNNCGLGSSVLGNYDGFCSVNGCTLYCSSSDYCPNDMSCNTSMSVCD
jgi:hypothetical protein